MTEYYKKTQSTCIVSILGTEYSVYLYVSERDDAILKEADGYTDKTSHKIVIAGKNVESDLDDYIAHMKKVLRHEIIHAFLFESGLGACAVWQTDEQEHPEQLVDWMAAQFPKMLKAFQTVGAQ